MTQARRAQIDLSVTPYYHCYSRCVRRAYLCGVDDLTGKSYEHRKQKIIERIALLTEALAIDVTAYAVMSNHYHVVLHVNKEKAQSWTVQEVIERWLKIHKGPQLIRRFHKNEALSQAELEAVNVLAAKFRKRLYCVSKFMACLNEFIARQSNLEDECKGRFWEGRFGSQALLDDTALLTCMMYVDLNPIRAGLNDSLETSDYTSIQQRLFAYAKQVKQKKTTKILVCTRSKKQVQKQSAKNIKSRVQPNLQLFSNQVEAASDSDSLIPCELESYIELIDWTGRVIRDDKKGIIPENVKPILNRLKVDPDALIETIQAYQSRFKYAVGPIEKLKLFAQAIHKKWLFGYAGAKVLYSH